MKLEHPITESAEIKMRRTWKRHATASEIDGMGGSCSGLISAKGSVAATVK